MRSTVCRPEVAVLTALLSGVAAQSLLFLGGVGCSPYPIWLSFAGMTIFLGVIRWKSMIAFVAVSAVLLLLTAYTFSYTGIDVVQYHFPMQDLIRRGWNPVKVATIDVFKELIGVHSLFIYHTLFLPRINALCGALVASAAGLYVGDAFLNYTMVLVLLSVSFSFARKQWLACRFMAFLFSLSIVSTTKITAIFTGYVDYLTYAGEMTALFSAAMYMKERTKGDLILLVMGSWVASLSKTTGLVVCSLAWMALVPWLRRDKCFWFGCVAFAMGLIVMGFSPLVTSWIHYGCPLYPTMSFSSVHPAIDITPDFSGNADALSMGYLARFCYAWISPRLALKCCALWHGNPDFNPIFTVAGGVGGFGGVFRFLLMTGVVALFFGKRLDVVTAICAFLVATSVITPLKYVGYSRYFPQMWAIPVLALFNFAYTPRWNLRVGWNVAFKFAVVALPVAIAFLCLIRSFAFYGRSLAFERARQESLEKMKTISVRWRSEGICFNSYSLSRRFESAGLAYDAEASKYSDDSINATIPVFSYDWENLWTSADDAKAETKDIDDRFPIADSVSSLLHFPWKQAYGYIPKVLMYNHGE